jgi:hypothetical protein
MKSVAMEEFLTITQRVSYDDEFHSFSDYYYDCEAMAQVPRINDSRYTFRVSLFGLSC